MIPTQTLVGKLREFPVFREAEDVHFVRVINDVHSAAKREQKLAAPKLCRCPVLRLVAEKYKDRFQISVYKYIFVAMTQGK